MYRSSERSNLCCCKIWKLTKNAPCFAKNSSVLKLLRSLMPSSFSVRFFYCMFPFFSHSRMDSHLGDPYAPHHTPAGECAGSEKSWLSIAHLVHLWMCRLRHHCVGSSHLPHGTCAQYLRSGITFYVEPKQCVYFDMG